MLPCKCLPGRNELRSPLVCIRIDVGNRARYDRDCNGASKWNAFLQQQRRLHKGFLSRRGLFPVGFRCIPEFRKYAGSLREFVNCTEIRQKVSVVFVRLVLGVMLVMSLSVAVSKSPSCKFGFCIKLLTGISRFWESYAETSPFVPCPYCTVALTEENLLFLEAWRTIDRAYVDKSFNGQSWFRYRENALRNEPMNTREETCTCFNFFLIIYCKWVLHLPETLI